MDPTGAVRLQPVPLCREIESCHSEGKSRLEVAPDTVSHHMLEMADWQTVCNMESTVTGIRKYLHRACLI